MTPAIYFRPNEYGPFHLGNAVVGYYTAKRARELGCRFILRLDNINLFGQQYQYDDAKRAEGGKQVLEFLDAIEMPPDDVLRMSDRWPMYRDVMSAFFASDVIRDWTGAYDGLVLSDELRGEIRMSSAWGEIIEQTSVGRSPVTYPAPYMLAMVNACDYIYDRIPLHVRGGQIWQQSLVDMAVLRKFREWLDSDYPEGYAGPTFLHIPMLIATNGQVMSKTNGVGEFEFGEFARQFNSPQEIRDALEGTIKTKLGKGDKISTAVSVPIRANGAPGNATSLEWLWIPQVGIRSIFDKPLRNQEHIFGELPTENVVDDGETAFWRKALEGKPRV